MEDIAEHYRHIMRYYFHEGLNAAETAHRICTVYGPDALKERVVRKWFARFRAENFSVKDANRSGRPHTVDTDEIITLVNANSHLTVEEIRKIVNVSHGSVVKHLRDAGYVSRADVWVPHELSDRNLQQRLDACDLLLKKNEEHPFLKKMITGDEKWIVYNNVKRRRSWGPKNSRPQTTAKAGLHPKKMMLCIWWDIKGVVYYELLPENQTINAAKYCEQLDRLREAVAKKRPELANRRGVTFHHDNARPHTSLRTREKLLEFSWDVLPHPPYSPDLAPSDYYLFRSLQNSLDGKNFPNPDAMKIHLERFFAEKPKTFWEKGILDLPNRWAKVITQKGAYII